MRRMWTVFAFALLIFAPPVPAWPEPADVTLLDPGASHRLGDLPEEGLLVHLQVAWEQAGSLLDTVGIARARAGAFQLLLLEDGALELSVFLPDSADRDQNGWVRSRSGLRLSVRRPHRVVLAIGPSLILIVDGQEQCRLPGPTVWPELTLFLGDFPGDANFAGRAVVKRGMVGRVRIDRVGPGDDDFSLTTLERRASALQETAPGEAERLSRRAVTLSPRQGPGFLARARACLRLGDLPAARADLDAALAFKPPPAGARKLRALVRHRQGDVAGGIADVEALLAESDDDEARGWLATWRAELENSPSAGRPGGEVFAVTPLVSVAVTPSATVQTVPVDERLTVTLPPAIRAAGGRLDVAAASPRRPEACGQFESIGSYEVTLGDRHEFSEDIVLECRFDPSRLEAGSVPEEEILAVRWDPDRQLWVELPSTIDVERGVIVTRTRHLSILGWIYRVEMLLYEPVKHATRTVIRTRSFRLYYDVAEIRQNRWIAGWSGETTHPTEYDYLWTYRNPAWIPFMRDAAYYLEFAYQAYRDQHLGPAPDLPVKVEFGPGLAGKDPGQYDHTVHRIYISSDKVSSSQRELKHRLAHELFHAIQNHDLKGDAEKAEAKAAAWWIESTAEYASCRIPWNLNTMGGGPPAIYRFLLRRPLTEAGAPDCPHGTADPGEIEYDKGYLVDYLVQRGAAFPPMYHAVMESYRTEGKLLEPLTSHLVSCGPATLPALYRDYVGWFLFDRGAPLEDGQPADPLLSTDNPKQQPVMVPAEEAWPAFRFRYALPICYTASAFAFRVSPTRVQDSRLLEVQARSLEAFAMLDLYVLPDGCRTDNPTRVATLTDTSSVAKVTLQAGQTLYVTAINLDSKRPASPTIEVRAGAVMPKPVAPDADRVTIFYLLEGTVEKTRKVLDEESEDRHFDPRTEVEALELDGMTRLHQDLPVKIEGHGFSCVGKVEDGEWQTDFHGTFDERFEKIERLVIHHRRRTASKREYDAARMISSDGVEFVEEYTITLTDIRRGTVRPGAWPYVRELDLPEPQRIDYRAESKWFMASTGELIESNSWTCGNATIRAGDVRVIFDRK